MPGKRRVFSRLNFRMGDDSRRSRKRDLRAQPIFMEPCFTRLILLRPRSNPTEPFSE